MANNLITCEKCSGFMRVVDKRNGADYIRRRRKCGSCGNTVATREMEIAKMQGIDKKALIQALKDEVKNLSPDEQIQFLDRMMD